MLKRIIENFKFSLGLFQLPKRELIYWLVIRAFTSAISPLMVPIIIRVMFDAIESRELSKIILSSVVLCVVLLPCFYLSYHIYVYSDAWVLKTMYRYQEVCLEKTATLNLQKRRENYTDGEVSNILNYSAWGLIQIWLHIFRIVSPFISIIVLMILEIQIYWGLLFLTAISVITDYLVLKVQGRKNYYYKNNLMDIDGKREQFMKKMIYEVEFVRTNGLQDALFLGLCQLRETYWDKEQKKEIVNIIMDALNSILNGIYNIVLWNSLSVIKNVLGAGRITSSNTIFDNFRTESGKLRKQAVNTIDKLIPIEKQKKLLSVDDVFSRSDLEDTKYLYEVMHLNFEIEGKHILRDISLKIEKGQKVAIIGENGAGKSTLLRCLCNLNQATSGIIKCNVWEHDMLDYVPAYSFIFSQTVLNNILMGENGDENKDRIFEYAERACLLLDGKDILLQEANTLSGGQGQRMAIARALIGDGKLLIMDEPTAALDIPTANRILKRIMTTRESVIYTTHRPEELQYADTVILMENGRVKYFDVREEFLKTTEYRNWCGKNNPANGG